MKRQVCPFHSDDDIAGQLISPEVGYRFICHRGTGHPEVGDYVWMEAPEAPSLPELSGLAAELGLDFILPDLLRLYSDRWVEFGVLEHAYATTHASDFARLVERYGHTAAEQTRYSASSFLAATLGQLHRRGEVALRFGPATGRWHYNGEISWWSLLPSPSWDRRSSWADTGFTMAYVPGNTETARLNDTHQT